MHSLPCVKMMVQLFAGSIDEFCRHHGKEGVSRYLRATREGLRLQKAIAREIWKEDEVGEHLKELGSYYVAGGARDKVELKREFHLLDSNAINMEWCDKERLQQVPGLSQNYTGGIYFPDDAIIDSSLYAKTLLEYVLQQSNGNVQFWSDSTLQQYTESENGVLLELTNGKKIRASQVVMATGALYQDPNLHGILKPCYSYLVNVPIPASNPSYCQKDSPNFFTWGYTHDWCFSNGGVRISGEDHYSAYKPPKLLERCAHLSQWALQQYGECNSFDDLQQQKDDFASFPQQYGVYGETPDMAPLIGKLNQSSRICYLMGCNAWGQTILSYCASLVPGILGFCDLTEEQQDILKLVTIQRFSQLAGVVGSNDADAP
ncbi:MAG: hypothetical protein SGILL_010053 [Bacillariaceae sp.]